MTICKYLKSDCPSGSKCINEHFEFKAIVKSVPPVQYSISRRSESTTNQVLVPNTWTQPFSFEIQWPVKKEKIKSLLHLADTKIYSDTITFNYYNSSWALELCNPFLSSPMIMLCSETVDKSKLWIKAKFKIKSNVSETHDDYELQIPEWKTDKRICEKLISKDEISKDKYWHNDFLLIICEIDVLVGDEDPNKPQATELITMEPLEESFTKLMESGAFSDVTIQVGQKLFKAHKVILATRCEYFNRMFSSDFKESISQEIQLEDIEPDIFEVVLSFIYSNKIPCDLESIAKDLLMASHLLEIKPLTKLCEIQLCKNITTINCLELLPFADLYNLNKLKEVVVSFVGKNFKEIRNKESWIEFKKNYAELAFEILETWAEAKAL